jgi:hypothetical protein
VTPAERLVEAHHVDAAVFVHLMTMGGCSAIPPRTTAAPPALAGFFDLSHVFDGPLRYGLHAAPRFRR